LVYLEKPGDLTDDSRVHSQGTTADHIVTSPGCRVPPVGPSHA
jgi:hypothetical protein